MERNLNKSNLIFIKTDSTLHLGSGHLERCITLSKELKKKGMNINFICRPQNVSMKRRIKNEGFGVKVLPNFKNSSKKFDKNIKSNNKFLLGSDWRVDAHHTIRLILKDKPKLLIVDHYGINVNWENLVKSSTGVKIMVIDGLANRRHNCEILLDYTYSLKGKRRWNNLINSDCKLLFGTKYTLIRSEFVQEKKNLIKKKGVIDRIFISFGGSDEINLTGEALNALDSLKRRDISTDVVVSKNNPNISEIRKKLKKKKNFQLHIQPRNIAKLMNKADISIGAGGTMIWERCYLGLPSLIISIANNQVNQSAAVHFYGAAINLGIYKKNTKEKIIKQLKRIIKNKKLILSMSRKSLKLMNISKKYKNYNPTKIVCESILKNIM